MAAVVAADPTDRRKVIVEPIGQPAELDEVMAPAREQIAQILRGYTPDQLKVLFDYFNRAADAYQHTAEQLRTTHPS